MTIQVNPTLEKLPKLWTTNPQNGINEKTVAPAYLCFAHELAHAYRAINETFDYKKTKYHFKIGEREIDFLWFNKLYVYERQEYAYEEFYNIGLLPDSKGNYYRYSENVIRSEHGLWLRGGY